MREVLKERHDAIRALIDERDRLYKERNDAQRTAVDAALTAVKEQTKASFDASEKAIVKAEEAQKAYNSAHNDLSRKMDDQYKSMTPQTEARLKWDNIEREMGVLRKDFADQRDLAQREINNMREAIMKDVTGLRESRSESGGKSAGIYLIWTIGIAVMGIILGLSALAVTLLRK